MKIPAMMISALRGGSGKTLVTIGIVSALAHKGYTIAPFKKGPDYIDAGWLALASGRSCHNLDPFFMDSDTILNSFHHYANHADIAVIEGNRGLYDGLDMEGVTSTAELAKLLGIPVLLCLDCTKTTRTMAAIVSGCCQFDPDVRIAGVILNRVAGARHESVLRQNIQGHCQVPVVGAIPKLKEDIFPERHMGLVPTPEHRWTGASVERTARIAEKYLDMDHIVQLAGTHSILTKSEHNVPIHLFSTPQADPQPSPKPIIGVIKDSAFQFYYPENIDALKQAGAELVFMSPLADQMLPEIDGLYVGGGFPETHAAILAQNASFRNHLKQLADNGLPIYAECGGLMYLGEKLVLDGIGYPMTGVLPIVFGFSKKPQGHGYTVVSVERENPYYPVGSEIRGHEFHYSSIVQWKGNDTDFAFSMKRGKGIIDGKDGVMFNNVLATYSHIHALGTPDWAYSMVKAARKFKSSH